MINCARVLGAGDRPCTREAIGTHESEVRVCRTCGTALQTEGFAILWDADTPIFNDRRAAVAKCRWLFEMLIAERPRRRNEVAASTGLPLWLVDDCLHALMCDGLIEVTPKSWLQVIPHYRRDTKLVSRAVHGLEIR